MSRDNPATGSIEPPDNRSLPSEGDYPKLVASTIPAFSTVSEHKLFRGIPSEMLAPLVDQCHMKQLSAGDILIKSGQKNEYLYLLVAGELQVYLDAADSQIGFSIPQGECIGEMSIIEDRLTSATVVAVTDSTVMMMHKELFWGEFVHLPGVVRNLLQLMTQRMRQDNRVIRETLENQLRYEHLQKELEMAGKIQTSILPHSIPLFPNHPQVDVAALLEPQREVGGDFFDAFPLDEERVCAIIGDVSGKGMPAAIFMVRVVTLLRMSLTKEAELDLTMQSINQILCQNNDESMFVTLLVGVLEVNTGRLNYVNGGHNPPFLARRGEAFALLPMSKGMLLGVFEQASFSVDEVILQPGDGLVLYTDGVTEAENPQLEMFSTERALEIVNSVPAEADPITLIKRLEDAVVEYARGWPQSDDITIMALRYLGPVGA